jgi:hypothetical protein
VVSKYYHPLKRLRVLGNIVVNQEVFMKEIISVLGLKNLNVPPVPLREAEKLLTSFEPLLTPFEPLNYFFVQILEAFVQLFFSVSSVFVQLEPSFWRF